MYHILTTEAELYLLSQKETSIYFVRDILQNRKKVLFTTDVKVRAVPHINGLRVDDMLCFVENKCPDGLEYLPNDYQKNSISNTLNESDFKEFIDNIIKQRENFILNKNSMEIKIDSRIVKVIQHSSMISTEKGRSHLLLRDKEEDKTVTGLMKIKERQVLKLMKQKNK